MDTLNAIVSSMKLSGSVFLSAEFSSPWCVTSCIHPSDCAAYFPEPRHVISYHYVQSGELLCSVATGAPARIAAGQILLLPRNDRHLLGSDLSMGAIDARDLVIPQGDGQMLRIKHGGGGERTRILCGFLGTLTPVDPFLLSLPSILVIDASEGASGAWLASSIRFASEGGHGSPELVSRLAELLFAEAVRQYLEALPPGQSGWLDGLRDPHVSCALGLVHARYAEDWTTDTLARQAGLSRSAFAERFTRFLGDPPMRYLARHRMSVAADLLKDGRHSVCNVAYSIGFNSEAAFNRAFKKEFGVPPGAWRSGCRGTPSPARLPADG
ncbi:cupin domain-containing protein [Sphingomonas qilianensis]|uniref:AraC family transcriptional regulator n=1 Tax=Sphingomonas qilianensis TaxID=1736690 RepID=A0ABU9XPI0_9SPHN